MQGLLRGRFTLGTTHSNPTTPKDKRDVKTLMPLLLFLSQSKLLWQSETLYFVQGRRSHSLSSSVLSSKAGLSKPALSVHAGPLPLVLLDPEGGEGVRSLSSVCGERGDLGGLVTIARSSPISHRRPSTFVC